MIKMLYTNASHAYRIEIPITDALAVDNPLAVWVQKRICPDADFTASNRRHDEFLEAQRLEKLAKERGKK